MTAALPAKDTGLPYAQVMALIEVNSTLSEDGVFWTVNRAHFLGDLLDALSLPDVGGEPETFAWLVESFSGQHDNYLSGFEEAYAGHGFAWFPTWTADHAKAMRFAREIDAATIARNLSPTAKSKAVEHGWIAKPVASDVGGAPRGEAVAWRWRWGRMGSNLAWHLSVEKPTFPEEGYEIEPLYATPPAQPAREVAVHPDDDRRALQTTSGKALIEEFMTNLAIAKKAVAEAKSTAARKDVPGETTVRDALAGFGATPPDKQIPENRRQHTETGADPAGTQAPPVDTALRQPAVVQGATRDAIIEECAHVVETALPHDYWQKTGMPRCNSEAEVFIAAAIRRLKTASPHPKGETL